MKNVILVLSLFVFASAFAAPPQVEVSVDGIRYACGTDGISADVCSRATQRATEIYKSCRSNGYSVDNCLTRAYPKEEKPKYCLEWEKGCYNECYYGGYSYDTCYTRCYK